LALVASCLAALMIALGATTIYSLTGSAHALRQLADDRLARLQDAQELAQQTLTIERMALQLSSEDTAEAVRETQRQIIEHLRSFDRLVDALAAASPMREDVGAGTLALHRSSQRFRNTINVEAQLRQTALAMGPELRPDGSLASLDEQLHRQANALAVAAREQSYRFTSEYRDAVQALADRSDRTRRWVIGEVAVSLLLGWLIADLFFARHVLGRLRRVSRSLRYGDSDSHSDSANDGGGGGGGGGDGDGDGDGRARVPVHGRDEIADMARAVEQFLEDRRQRKQAEDALKRLNAELEERVAQRTWELSTALSGRMAEIATRQRAEELARASEHFLNSIVENIPDVIFVKDAATLRFVRFNRAGEELLGYRREELIGKSVHDLFPAREAERFCANDRDVLESRKLVNIPEEPVFTRYGPRLVHTMKIPILDVHGEPEFLLGISRDITESKRAEAELIESERRYREVHAALAHANRVTTMGQLMASISHEIKQPIAASTTNAQAGLLWMRAQPPNMHEVRQAFERIDKDMKRASDVINGIHGLVKKNPPAIERLHVNEAIDEAIALVRSEIAKSGVRVITCFTQDVPDVRGERVALQQVMLNLMLNAIEAMSAVEHGARDLTISTARLDEDAVIVTVGDSGPGLALDDMERPFEPFYTSKAGGMGMGLAICRSIAEAHGGKLWASANVPRGAVFHFTMPAMRFD
jgi:PAS domain S-box-containing protein